MPIPTRFFEPNILRNPLQWMGIWTPQGWRSHAIRRGRARRVTVTLSGDGRTTFFPEALRDPESGRVEWSDDLHLPDDPFTDNGIYPADPRVEYPLGRPRWAVSHTLLFYPVADHGLYTHEYTWDLTHGHLQTRFRQHVVLEEARTDAQAGLTVAVRHVPLSTSIEGNVNYPLPNSAVRGVWSHPEKSGPNYYTQRKVQRLSMLNAVYCPTPHVPVVQCFGLYATTSDEPLDSLFDPDTGDCLDRQFLVDRLSIPLDQPKLGMLLFPVRRCLSKMYEGLISVPAALTGHVDESHVEWCRTRLGSSYRPGQVGYGLHNHFQGDRQGAQGYNPAFDYNCDGTIGEDDFETLLHHLGREVRYNLYRDGYFGGDWLSTSICCEPEHRPGIPLIADYEYGGGYDAQTGVIRLLETPGRSIPVWVEYHYDAPAEPGENNIRIHLYREN